MIGCQRIFTLVPTFLPERMVRTVIFTTCILETLACVAIMPSSIGSRLLFGLKMKITSPESTKKPYISRCSWSISFAMNELHRHPNRCAHGRYFAEKFMGPDRLVNSHASAACFLRVSCSPLNALHYISYCTSGNNCTSEYCCLNHKSFFWCIATAYWLTWRHWINLFSGHFWMPSSL